MSQQDNLTIAEWAARRCAILSGQHLENNDALNADPELKDLVDQLAGYARLVDSRIREIKAQEGT